MPRSKREKILVGATLGLLLAALAYTQLEKTHLWRGWTQPSGEIKRLRDQYARSLATLKREKSINDEFVAVVGQYGRDPSLTPEKQFNQQINALCLRLGFQGRQIDPCSIEDIPNVKEYGLIYLPVRIDGEFDKIVRLLSESDKAGYLINELSITGTMDSPILKVRLVVARPVRLADLQTYRPDGRERSG